MTYAARYEGVTLIGVPTDIGAGLRGASMGPQALRVAGLGAALMRRGLDVQDRGDLTGPANPLALPIDGFRHLQETAQWSRLAHDAVYAELAIDRLPILLGGDHSMGIGSVSAAARHCRDAGKTLRVLWLDAHTDFNTAKLTPTGNTHGMPVACLCGYGPDVLTSIGGHTPAIQCEQVRQLGIRSVDDGERELVHDAGIEVFDMRDIDELGMRAVMEKALSNIDDNTHLHVSFDVDFLDPSIAPGVGTPLQGGPTNREAQLFIEIIYDFARVG
jgi:arginase